ncbi:hypothetical protein MXB_3302, partial [Myxobolus squamalis]
GDSFLKVHFQNTHYEVLHVHIEAPSHISFSFSCPTAITDDDHDVYYFDIDCGSSDPPNNINSVMFDKYPFVCTVEAKISENISVKEGINPKSGLVSCVLLFNSPDVRNPSLGPSEIIIRAKFPKSGFKTEYIHPTIYHSVFLYPKLSIRGYYNSSVDVNQCIFKDIQLTPIDSNEQLRIDSTLPCIDASYFIHSQTHYPIIVLKLINCVGIIKSDRTEYLYILRKASSQNITLKINIIFDQLPCLHASTLSFGMVVEIIVALVIIFLTYIYRDLFMTFTNFVYRNYARVKMLFGAINKTINDSTNSFNQTDQSQFAAPKQCSLKSTDNSLGADGDLTTELYTTRKEFLNSSFKYSL